MTARSPLRPVEEGCYWMATRPARAAEPLEGSLEADVAIIGAGFTGLWTAIFAKGLEAARRVVVLEQGLAGYGGSGRNAGIVGETIDHSHELAIAHFGLDEARELARIGRENLDELECFLTERRIDAGFERTGQLIVALTAEHVASLTAGCRAAHRVGADDWRLLSREETQAELASPLYRGALLAPRNGLIEPMALVEGLRREAVGLGVRVLERTGVTSVGFPAGRVVIETERGRIVARKGVLATNAYTHLLFPRLRRYFLPLYDYILVSEPLTRWQRESIGWRNRQGVSDARTFFNYYRLTADDRILWGTSEAVYYSNDRVDTSCDNSASHYRSLEESFRLHFPQLADVAFPFAWGGPIASTTRLTPFFGTVAGCLSYGLGYTGHGIGSSRVAGKILAHLALERSSPLLELSMVRRKPFPYPPEPFRRLAVRAVTRALRRVDRGARPGLILRILEKMRIGFSS